MLCYAVWVQPERTEAKVSNQNAGYTVQTPAVAFAANLGSLRSNIKFYGERGELGEQELAELKLAVQALQIAVAFMKCKSQGDGP